MTSSSLVGHDDDGVQQNMALDPWVGTSQYALTPGNFRWSPASPSDTSFINVDPISPVDYASPQQTASQKNSLPLLQFGDWEEGRIYNEDPPTYIHYLIEWKVTLNNRTAAKDTEQDPVLAPRFHWRLCLQPKLKELLIQKYLYRKLESDDTSVVVSAIRQKGLTLRFDGTDID